MLFSVAANLRTDKVLSTEEKLAKFEVYAKLAEAQIEIANGAKGVDADTVFKNLMEGNMVEKIYEVNFFQEATMICLADFTKIL